MKEFEIRQFLSEYKGSFKKLAKVALKMHEESIKEADEIYADHLMGRAPYPPDYVMKRLDK